MVDQGETTWRATGEAKEKVMMESFGFSVKTYLSSSLDCGETQSFYRFFGTIQIDTFPPVETFLIEENHQVSPLITYIRK